MAPTAAPSSFLNRCPYFELRGADPRQGTVLKWQRALEAGLDKRDPMCACADHVQKSTPSRLGSPNSHPRAGCHARCRMDR
jgi:hypothetical protein